MTKKLILDAPEWNGINCDSEPSSTLEATGIPKKSCDMRNVSGMFPPAFNELRKQLFENHWDLGFQCLGMMIYNHDILFETLNSELDCICHPDMGMQLCCERWLKALERRVRVSNPNYVRG